MKIFNWLTSQRLSIKVVVFIILLAVQSCATAPKTLRLAEVNRSEGTVKLSTTVGGLRSLVVDWPSTNVVAQNACRNWGYSSASRLEQREYECAKMGTGEFQNTCTTDKFTYTYQCTGSPTSNVNLNNERSMPTDQRSSDTLVGQLQSLDELYRSGVLTEEEFNSAKRSLLGL
jgi:hypothetical protein